MYISKNQIEAARRYARADRSDPFAFSRAMAHLRNGVASLRAIKGEDNPVGQLAFYDAKVVSIPRVTPKGEHYAVPGYTGMVRP